ncbi:hypothetical protein ACP275_13G129800 [Erythranthe tilingii]
MSYIFLRIINRSSSSDHAKMILFVFIFVVFLQIKETAAVGKLDFLGELSGREELVKWAGYGEEKLSTVVIGGKLLCHAGAVAKDKTSIQPYPVSGAVMGVVCGGKGKKKGLIWAGRGSTDSSGEFQIDVPSRLHAIPNLQNICHVRVLLLPSSSPCRQSCTRNHSKKTIKLDSVDEGVRSYTTHNIHLMMPHRSHT